MIELRKDISPSEATLDKLKEFQDEIDKLNLFADKSAKAKDMFSKKNTKKNKQFQEIKKCLTEMCNSTRRCVYCEDSIGDEVEHIYPKDIYPEKCFSWDNYVYACGPCNGPKNNKFAVFKNDDGSFAEVNPPKGKPANEPPKGEGALINPRIENPLNYAILDLSGTFKFYPLPDLNQKDKKKMEYSYNEVLRLNNAEREPLRQARENAYENYSARLFKYVNKKNAGESQSVLEKIVEGIQKENHPTVWKEMQRYYNQNLLDSVDIELKELFDNAHEALNW
jgi:uncharacterized protein (TIGR02646 family)